MGSPDHLHLLPLARPSTLLAPPSLLASHTTQVRRMDRQIDKSVYPAQLFLNHQAGRSTHSSRQGPRVRDHTWNTSALRAEPQRARTSQPRAQLLPGQCSWLRFPCFPAQRRGFLRAAHCVPSRKLADDTCPCQWPVSHPWASAAGARRQRQLSLWKQGPCSGRCYKGR